MAVKATSDKVFKKRKSLRIIAIVLFALAIGFAFLIPGAMEGSKVVKEGQFWLGFFGVFIFILAPLIPWSWRTVYTRYAKTVGCSLEYTYDENGIYLQDSAEDKDIEKNYKWQDIKYVQLQRFVLNQNKGTFLTALLFVIDEDTFHAALKLRKMKPEYEQRSMELNGGFFIIADAAQIYNMADLWGGQVR
ncbi:MAG: hypothetical protein JXN65_11160 [Clostridia bacterium]|nr:hypothetical protein [Clostridia bacterium]